MRTHLARVLGLGSARSGTEDFLRDRMRAVLLLVLTPYVVGLGIWLFGRPHAFVVERLALPWVALPLAAFLFFGLLHMRLGMQTIIEDYIYRPGLKLALTLANQAFCLVVGGTMLFALARLALT